MQNNDRRDAAQDAMADVLELTDEQQAALDAMRTESRTAMQALRQNNAADLQAARQAMFEANQARVRQVLTPEQFEVHELHRALMSGARPAGRGRR